MMMNNKVVRYAVATALSVVILTPQMSEAGTKKAKALTAASVFDAEKRKRTKRKAGNRLSYSLYFSSRFQSERNRRRDDDVDDLSEGYAFYLGFVGRLDLGLGMIAFGHGEYDARSKTTHDQTYDLTTRWTTKEAFVSLEVNDEARITVGRMRFSDLNKWVADAAVDGIHFGHKTKSRVTELAAFTGTNKVTSTYLLAHHGRVRNNLRYGALGLIEKDGSDGRVHLAGYTNAVVSQRFSYELNVGLVAGDAANGKNAGIGFDVRTTQKMGSSTLKPQLMFGFAAGSTGYRQSGLHSNKTYNLGQTQVHRYGYVFQPDLTNLAVGSVAVGIRPSRKLSVDLGLHLYGQLSKSTTGPSARLSGATTGNSAFLGHEVSLVGAWRPSKKTKVEFGVGHFKPGPAYVDQSSATRVYARMSVTF
ncbi:alginate export family protein [Sulfitobacter sp.]|uniref:alginate export family protein n=1 Tax=Sulfitobacter sp. TaxID=1903071 RepID=UPI00300261EF